MFKDSFSNVSVIFEEEFTNNLKRNGRQVAKSKNDILAQIYLSTLNHYELAQGMVRLPNRMNFWKSSKGGGGGIIFNPKIYVADFGNFKQGFLSIKLIKRRVISGFRVCFFNNCIDIN